MYEHLTVGLKLRRRRCAYFFSSFIDSFLIVRPRFMSQKWRFELATAYACHIKSFRKKGLSTLMLYAGESCFATWLWNSGEMPYFPRICPDWLQRFQRAINPGFKYLCFWDLSWPWAIIDNKSSCLLEGTILSIFGCETHLTFGLARYVYP